MVNSNRKERLGITAYACCCRNGTFILYGTTIGHSKLDVIRLLESFRSRSERNVQGFAYSLLNSFEYLKNQVINSVFISCIGFFY